MRQVFGLDRVRGRAQGLRDHLAAIEPSPGVSRAFTDEGIGPVLLQIEHPITLWAE